MINEELLYDNYNDRIFFPFTDRYLQEYFKYDFYDLDYFLKLSIFWGANIFITAANTWQSNLTYSLYKNSNILLDSDSKKGIIHLSTRQDLNNLHPFEDYFISRSEEIEHFIVLPGIYSLLDSHSGDKKVIAKELDESVYPIERVERNVSRLISKNINQMFITNNIQINEQMVEYLHNNIISRLAIVNYILGLPYHYKEINYLIERSNFAYFNANAESNKAALLYPDSKYKLNLYMNKRSIDFLHISNNAGLTKKFVNSISYSSIYKAYKLGLLKILNFHFRLLVNANLKNNICKLIYKTIYAIGQSIAFMKYDNIKRSMYNYAFDNISFNENASTYFIYELNLNLAQKSKENTNMENCNDISLSSMMEEMNRCLSLNDLKSICVIILNDYEQFPHSNKVELSRELCLYCKRNNIMHDLLSECLKINSRFNIFPKSTIIPSALTDWKGSNDGQGDYISDSEYEKVIESQNRFQSVRFLEDGLKVKERICMITAFKNNHSIRATGYLLKSNYILTNKHVLPNKLIAEDAKAIFGYDDCDNSVQKIVKLDSNKMYISNIYDLSLIALSEKIEVSIDVSMGNPNDCINDIIPIIQHPNGLPKQICIGHNSLKYVDNERIQYLTDTLPGSSGSPVFNSKWQLIGLHSKGGNICEPRTGKTYFRNEGINIEAIKLFIESETPLKIEELL